MRVRDWWVRSQSIVSGLSRSEIRSAFFRGVEQTLEAWMGGSGGGRGDRVTSLSEPERRSSGPSLSCAQMELDPNFTTEPEPSYPERRSYWVLRLVRATIATGGYLTPTLYAPKDVWTQVNLLLCAVGSWGRFRPLCFRAFLMDKIEDSVSMISFALQPRN